MATQIFRKLSPAAARDAFTFSILCRTKITSAQYVASRARDPTFEKLMDKYKNFLKVISIQDLILASNAKPPSISLDFLSRLSQRLHLNRGPATFLRNYPHIFHIYNHPIKLHPFCTLTPAALKIIHQEAEAIEKSLPSAVTRLVKLLSMSLTKKLPLRAVFKVWRELGLPDNFEDSIISSNPEVFSLEDGNEPNTHFLVLNDGVAFRDCLIPAVEKWRVVDCCKEDSSMDRTEMMYSFKYGFPPGMRLKKDFKAKVKEWQKLPYVGPYEEMGLAHTKISKSGGMRMEKRAVGIVHEFLSLTVEKMVEVEKISHFRKWFGIDLNVRDLFLDHPGMFYLSTKGKRHTVFLREAYERGRLVVPNPIYDARMNLLYLVLLGRRGIDVGCDDGKNEDSEVEET
ncbi:protein ROOT PRIMORDIUM DEFECTIVE 1 [Andrographis paniculata]|uniref:protein ROOT PRIMORDIUM DEFECTIVE 1 n=1 Tax=Andrographis paniculata TaxID=175694 RepID=UPI0021E93185|nr:protein ROOT PRIMORDIUM DEFECTIVE 1 [Andrographis paniculata]XP_051134904.1 protein ROOT PRIMORDIUM DEFECTIVE 1 [Andrographis paniculata]XP_051134905.1 protein ROOT PRIMORDIUM DEFECTIVE 1 [Andrographis paniculata]